MGKKYDLWWYWKETEEWIKINKQDCDSLEEVLKILKRHTSITTKFKIKPSLLKIVTVDDTSWLDNIPQYLLEKGMNKKI